MHNEGFSLLKKAYTAAVISGDVVGQKFLKNYNQRVYGTILEI